jgi:hypothetical protein
LIKRMINSRSPNMVSSQGFDAWINNGLTSQLRVLNTIHQEPTVCSAMVLCERYKSKGRSLPSSMTIIFSLSNGCSCRPGAPPRPSFS